MARSQAARASDPFEDTNVWFSRSLPMIANTHPHIHELREELSMLDDAEG